MSGEKGLSEDERPDAAIIGENGNVYVLLAVSAKALKRAGHRDKALELKSRVMGCGSYDEALQIMQEYIQPVSIG